jgi:hypothetical protein
MQLLLHREAGQAGESKLKNSFQFLVFSFKQRQSAFTEN